jgi:hypothetical protein
VHARSPGTDCPDACLSEPPAIVGPTMARPLESPQLALKVSSSIEIEPGAGMRGHVLRAFLSFLFVVFEGARLSINGWRVGRLTNRLFRC